LERAEDLEEVQAMIDEGEGDCAVDELRWLLEECRDFIEAHYLLGEIALENRDFRLARGHFGYAFELGRSALPEGDFSGVTAYSLPANQPFFHAAKGLAACLHELQKRKTAVAILREIVRLDPSDPLGCEQLLATWLDGSK
jgi:tetratricopeptide (TPR) repeat protein